MSTHGGSAISVAAVDLGAESGRVAQVSFDGSTLNLDIVRRFPHQPLPRGRRLEWNLPHLWSEISAGLAELAKRHTPLSVGVDSWGVDFGMFDSAGALMENPLAYREQARIDAFDAVTKSVGSDFLYEHTGAQVLPINTLFGLAAELTERPGLFDSVDYLLMMADVFHRQLAGTAVTEYTMASTSGMLDMRNATWSSTILDAVGIPMRIMPELVTPGTVLGTVTGDLADAGLRDTKVIVPAAHDTASAVLAIPYADRNTLFVSSGTWSLVGVVIDSPIITDQTRQHNITNEGGYGNTIRLLRNVMGLWMLQESRRQWEREGLSVDYTDLVAMASAEPKLRSMVDPSDTFFFPPGDMPGRIREYCQAVGQPVPETPSQIARTIFDSLALGYRHTLETLSAITGDPITTVRVVGGGSQNEALQQATADATGRPTICGAVEATALGNAAAQLISLGEFASTSQAWDAIAHSTSERVFEPKEHAAYDEVYEEFCSLREKFEHAQMAGKRG